MHKMKENNKQDKQKTKAKQTILIFTTLHTLDLHTWGKGNGTNSANQSFYMNQRVHCDHIDYLKDITITHPSDVFSTAQCTHFAPNVNASVATYGPILNTPLL